MGNYSRKSNLVIAIGVCALAACRSAEGVDDETQPSAAWAGPSAVIDWNDIASQALNTAIAAGRPGTVGPLDLAMVHVAVHDAVQAIEGRFEPYHMEIPGARGSPVAATAKAAHDVLLNLFPAQAASLDTAYHDYLANNGLAEDDPGVAVGQQAAAGIVALRVNDGRFPPNPPPFIGGTDPGVWRPTPSYLPGPLPGFAPMAVPWLAAVTPFTLTSPTQFRPGPPPALTSARYTRDYNEVKTLGAFANSTRTPEQTDIAYFYADSPLSIWNRALRTIAAAHVHGIGDSARLFALANLAAADAIITAWDTKRHYVYWRPVTAIQEGENDGNARTAGDPAWQPLINTPNYPEYSSGANNVTGAMSRALVLFFGTDKLNFSLTSTYPLAVQKTRMYTRFSDAAQDVVDARIYEGIHFRTADVVARRQGRHVAKWAFRHFLRPIHDHHHDDDDEDDHDDD
jgi:hypothetical protein